jgi:hypothetical protein
MTNSCPYCMYTIWKMSDWLCVPTPVRRISWYDFAGVVCNESNQDVNKTWITFHPDDIPHLCIGIAVILIWRKMGSEPRRYRHLVIGMWTTYIMHNNMMTPSRKFNISPAHQRCPRGILANGGGTPMMCTKKPTDWILGKAVVCI